MHFFTEKLYFTYIYCLFIVTKQLKITSIIKKIILKILKIQYFLINDIIICIPSTWKSFVGIHQGHLKPPPLTVVLADGQKENTIFRDAVLRP
jgi:hypothetical protein